MRIAIVTETWPPEINGVALTVQALALGLATQGHTVELVRPRQAGEADIAGDPHPLHEVLTQGASLPRYPGLRFGMPARRRLRRHWSATRPDAVYVATEGPLGLSAIAVARGLGIATSAGFHTRFDDFARHYGLAFLTPLVRAYLRHFHNRAGATLVPTAELADFLHQQDFRHVHVLRRAVDTRLFHPARRDPGLREQWGLAPGDLAVVHVGRLAAEKNLPLLLGAFRAIQQRQPRARLILVGDGPMRAALAAQHADVLFAGMRHGADLARHYANADLFLFPSLSETFGNVTLEAMASGVPVVAFDYGAAREVIDQGRNGLRVPFADAEAFIAAATALADDRARREAMRPLARIAAEGLSPQTVTAHFAQLLASLATRRAA